MTDIETRKMITPETCTAIATAQEVGIVTGYRTEIGMRIRRSGRATKADLPNALEE